MDDGEERGRRRLTRRWGRTGVACWVRIASGDGLRGGRDTMARGVGPLECAVRVEGLVSELEGRIRGSFAAQGLMATLGAELVRVAAGEVHIALSFRPEIAQQDGYVHAGALTSIVDSACGYAALTVAPAGFGVLTVEFKVNFMRPALGDRFLAIGRVRRAGRTLTVCQGEIVGQRGAREDVVALMQATIANVASRA